MKNILFVLLFLILDISVSAQISLPKLFSSHMVLQRNIEIPVWGNAKPGTKISAVIKNKKTTAVADANGKWMLHLPKFKAGGPYQLKIYETKNLQTTLIKLDDILIGDVWLASGQSNMEFQLQQSKDAKAEIANANYPNIRFLLVEQNKKLLPQTNIQTKGWKVCDTNNVKDVSAVAYFFARKIQHDEHVPLGIIESTWGGTPIQAWTSKEKLLSFPNTANAVLANDTLTENDFVQDSIRLIRLWDIVYHPQNNADKIIPFNNYTNSTWATVQMPRLIKDFGIGNYEGMMWLQKKVVLPENFSLQNITLHMGHPEMNYSLYFNGTEICKNVWNASPNHSYTIPQNIVKTGENIISLRLLMLWSGGGLNPPADSIFITNGNTKISLAGEWVYNKNVEPAIPKIQNFQYYPSLLYNAMIHPVIPYGIKGFIWYQGEANDSAAYNYQKLFPMLIADWRERWQQGNLPFLFVQLANYKKQKAEPSESEWAELREAQSMALSQPNTGMACTIDIGDANNIHPTNKQEVGRRLALEAEKIVYKHQLVSSGPMYKNFKIEGNKIIIRFNNIGAGLITTNNASIAGFSIAGTDKKFYWADAIIKENEVIVSSKNVLQPVAVRYAWADNPVCNLINKNGLPAIPFRTDRWRGITQK